MMKRLMIAAALAASAGAITPVLAQSALSDDRVLEVYGNDPCPEGTICVRKGESERYRIPKNLREAAPSAHNERWADRARSIQNVGNVGTGSCTSVGAGGWTGCWSKQMQDFKAQRAADKEAANSNPN